MKYPDHNLVDFAIGDVRARNHVVDIREALQASRTTATENSYITVYRFPEPYRQHQEATGSVRGYVGTAYADFLPFDIDREGDLDAALQSARGLGFTLQERCDLRSDQIRYFFSGAKGFHLLIPTLLFGEVSPTTTLPAAFRAVALRLAGMANQQIDRVIYDQNRLFRLPNTKHSSGLWKVELSWEELSTWSTDQIRFAARTPRDNRGKAHDLEPNEFLMELYSNEIIAAESKPNRTTVAGGLAGAIACTVQPFYSRGKRHGLVLALAGYAAKRSIPRETCLGAVEEMAGKDDELEDRLRAVGDTYDKVRKGEQVKGYTDLAELMDAPDLEALKDLLGDRRPTPEPGQITKPEEESPPYDIMLGDVLERMAEEKQRPIDATPTPWPAWNMACRGAGGATGIARGWHIVVGARSGNGKSLLGANMAVSAIRGGERAAIVSLEMAQIEMQTRIMAIAGHQKINSLDHGKHFNLENWKAAAREMHLIRDRTGGMLYINRRPIKRLGDVERSIRYLHEEGVRWFVVDYLQLAAIGAGRMADLLDRITEVSSIVRGLAQELGVITVGMSQLNREASKSKERPTKEGLMGGSPLENDAEQVLLLDHSRIDRTPHGIRSWAILDKNRHGELVEIPTFLNTQTLDLRERMPDEITAKETAA